jgi:arsenical pump membrane protein
VLFAIALFALVDVIVDEGATVLRDLFGTGESLGSLAQLAGTSTGLANLLNNLPAYLVTEPFAGTTTRLVTVLVGVNVGPMVLAWGSLANLLWLRACRARGLDVSAVRFGLEGLLVVPAAVAAGVLAIWLT